MVFASKRRKSTFLGGEEILSFLENDEGVISDFAFEYSDSESNDDENDVLAISNDLKEDNDFIDNCSLNEEEGVAIKNPHQVRKNILSKFNDTINEDNYDPLPVQTPQTFKYVSSDKTIKYS